MAPIKCFIIDDEPLARQGLAQYVQEVDFLDLIGTAESPLALGQQMPQIELLFLDVEMPKLNGIDFLRSLKHPPMVILTTAYPQYALEGYQLDVLDYLLKPITFQRFFQAAQKAQNRHQQHTPPIQMMGDFFVKVGNKYEKVLLSELLYVEGMQNYVAIHTQADKHLTLLTLKAVEAYLPPDRFLRVHRSYIVAKDKVTAVEGNELLMGEARIPIGRHLRDTVVQEIVEKRLWKK
ncbi:MAG: LytR/AlgR family response regulator transcription factor [Bernardetiaceae bacterium]